MGAIDINSKTPKYWGSWKGQVIKAIIRDGAKKWEDIHELTGLSAPSFNRALAELFSLGIIKKANNEYYMGNSEVCEEYTNFLSTQESETPEKFFEDKQKNLFSCIDEWKKLMNLDFSLASKHFYLVGGHLDQLSQLLIGRAESEVLVVNPFVTQCDLSDTLRNAGKRGIKVRLITRPPDDKKLQYRKEKEEYHNNLNQEGIFLTYNKKAHAKLIVIDRLVGIVSSMNFYSGSSGGASWEAGLISVEGTVVEKIVNSILNLLELPETKELEITNMNYC